MTKRRSISRTERVRLFKLHKGVCHLCRTEIDGTKEAWDIEHVIPLAMGGADDDANRQLAHKRCHADKTKADVAAIAKAKRVEARHIGAKPEGRPLTDATPRKSGAASKPLTRALPERKRPLFA